MNPIYDHHIRGCISVMLLFGLLLFEGLESNQYTITTYVAAYPLCYLRTKYITFLKNFRYQLRSIDNLNCILKIFVCQLLFKHFCLMYPCKTKMSPNRTEHALHQSGLSPPISFCCIVRCCTSNKNIQYLNCISLFSTCQLLFSSHQLKNPLG